MSTSASHMLFITGIHCTKNVLTSINGITFLFDPNWEVGNSDVATFPVAFFHLKSFSEILESDISQKQMLFYNSGAVANSKAVNGSLLNVVADNIVLKPKQYKLEVIIPYSDLTLSLGNSVLNPYQWAGIASFMTTKSDGTAVDKIASFVNLLTPSMALFKNLISSMLLIDFNTKNEDFVTRVMSTPDYNKNSLETMFNNRSILKLKLWTGWKYKYVALKSIEITKEADEDGVYHASITCQEVPILTVRDSSGASIQKYTNPRVLTAGNVMKTWLNKKEDI